MGNPITSTPDELIAKSQIDQRGLCHQPQYARYWDLFFAETALERRPARNLCGGCPVREECLRWALEHKEIWGIWGGCDESEIRRALWVNALGASVPRSRFPHCPYCKARPNKLYVVGHCDLKSGAAREQVECLACGFSWKAQTSVSAVKAYWRDHAQQVRAKVVRRRVAIRAARRAGIVFPLSSVPEVESIMALVAAVDPKAS